MEGARYTIAAVSKLTGVGCHALRVWERRYGFPIPERSESGHRRYGADQVEIVRALAKLTAKGLSVSQAMTTLKVGRFVDAGPDPAVGELAADRDRPLPVAGSEKGGRVGEWVDHLMACRYPEADALFEEATGGSEPVRVLAEWVEPALVEVGERWFRRECQVFHERCATLYLRRKLSVLVDRAVNRNLAPSRLAVLACVQGERHTGGLLALSLVLETNGWRTINLGADLPVRELRDAIGAFRPDAVCLSFVLSRNINKRFDELDAVRNVPIVVGGRSILNYQGLARRHGFIPVTENASRALPALVGACEAYRAPRERSGPESGAVSTKEAATG